MTEVAALGGSIEERKDLGTDEAGRFAYWSGQEAIAEKEERKWIKRAREIVKRYRDERNELVRNTHRFNILWSNVQTLKPTLYARTPKPDVRRRFLDADPTARYAATLLERCLSYSCDAFDFDAVMKAVVEDRLLPGRGVARVLYVPHFGQPIERPEPDEGADDEDENEEFEGQEAAAATVDSPGDDGNAEPEEAQIQPADEPERAVDYEEAVAKYVFWEDYREGPARQWIEVPWIRFRSYLTRKELVDRFGKEKGEQVTLDYAPKGMESYSVNGKQEAAPPDIYKKAVVHEYWDKTNKEVVWLAPETSDLILDVKDDPLELPDFFPCPDPLLATTTNDKRIPVPDYVEYQDQARELDKLTARIDVLQNALKVSGVYAGEEKQILQRLIDEGTENRLIPIGDFQSWSDKGGIGKIIEWMPIQQVAETLIQLYNARDRTKALLYELTGISDIMRGMTSPDETAAAQEMKSTFSTRRISPQQKDVAKFARGLLQLMGGVISAHFSGKTISMITGLPQLDPVPPLPPRPQPPIMFPQIAPPMPPSPAAQGMPLQQNAPSPPAAGVASSPPDPRMQAYEQAMQAWQQQLQKVQQVIAANTQKQQAFDAAVALIKSDGVHGFRIDIEADSTIAPDENAEKKARTEFIGQFIPLMEQVVPIAQGNPALADLAREITLFGVRGFPVARPLEEAIEKAFNELAQMPPQQGKQPPQKGKSPQELQLAAKMDDTKLTIAREKNAVEMQNIAQDRQEEAARLEASRERDRTRLALETARGAHQDALAGARLTHIEARDAKMLS